MQTKENCSEEIHLREVIATIFAYKRFIFLFILATMLFVALFIFLQKPLYKIEAHIALGYINNFNANKKEKIFFVNQQEERVLKFYNFNQIEKTLFLNPYEIKLLILNHFRNNPICKVNVEVQRKNPSILHIVANAYSKKDTLHCLEEVFKLTQEKEEKKITNYINYFKTKINSLQKNKEKKEKILTLLQKKYTNTQDTLFQVLLFDLQSKIDTIDSKINQLNDKISSDCIKKASFFGKKSKIKSYYKPKRVVIVTIALISALLVAIFLVFLIEFIKAEILQRGNNEEK